MALSPRQPKFPQAIRPIYGIAWHMAVVMQLKTENMNPALCKLRNSLLPRSEYGRVANFIKEAFPAGGLIPPEFLDW